ncbi:SpoIVB peptidase S55 domain-containing protein, partial [Phascolarctobacterium succinatutens]
MRVFLLALLFCCQLLTAAAANVPLMPVRDLRAGMQGIGKTVISGDTIETFNVEILGVNGSEAMGYNIFVRLYGDLIEKTGGVAQGMSGSPVYVDGRLVGAVAFGKTFNDPHYCFLTPIGKMLPLLDEPRELPADWIPKGTALMAGGFTEYGMEYLQEKLQPFGLTAVNSGGTGASSDKPLEPGSSVGVALMQGDMTLGALGTVTWTDDSGKILAFGHPFMQRGSSNFFMNKVWVLGVVPNLQSSYKVGNLGEAIGSITQDRASGIGGVVGKQPDSIPMFVTVNDSSRGQANSMRMRLIDDEQLVPSMVDAAVVNT